MQPDTKHSYICNHKVDYFPIAVKKKIFFYVFFVFTPLQSANDYKFE